MECGMEDFWYGMEESCQYDIWKNHIPFHTMPWLEKHCFGLKML